MHAAFVDALAASAAPSPEMQLYARFVGSWTGRCVVHLPDGATRESPAEAHFALVLEGRAVQDVWIAPARAARGDAPSRMYGTTLRVYDPAERVWRITWLDPVQQLEMRMIGRAVGDDIVQEALADGVRTQWCFTEIRPDSFHWIARRAAAASDAWTITAEFFFQRVGGR
jgi:hypothetical protein